MFVKGLEGSDENASILQDAPHPEVNVLQHLAAFSHRLKIYGHHMALLAGQLLDSLASHESLVFRVSLPGLTQRGFTSSLIQPFGSKRAVGKAFLYSSVLLVYSIYFHD